MTAQWQIAKNEQPTAVGQRCSKHEATKEAEQQRLGQWRLAASRKRAANDADDAAANPSTRARRHSPTGKKTKRTSPETQFKNKRQARLGTTKGVLFDPTQFHHETGGARADAEGAGRAAREPD